MSKLERVSVEAELKELIVSSLGLEDISVEEIESDMPLFADDEGLALDSIDALELGLAISKKYKIEINSEQEDIQQQFYSVRTLSEFVVKSSTVGPS